MPAVNLQHLTLLLDTHGKEANVFALDCMLNDAHASEESVIDEFGKQQPRAFTWLEEVLINELTRATAQRRQLVDDVLVRSLVHSLMSFGLQTDEEHTTFLQPRLCQFLVLDRLNVLSPLCTRMTSLVMLLLEPHCCMTFSAVQLIEPRSCMVTHCFIV